MSGSSKETYPFVVRHPVRGARITVYDGYDEIVDSSDEVDLHLDLGAGLYAVRTEVGGLMNEQVVRHAAPTDLRPTAPGVYSAAPLAGAATSHEYYTIPAVRFSGNETAPRLGGNAPGEPSLFIFLRAARQEARDRWDFVPNLSLHQGEQVLTEFEAAKTARDENKGWIAFSTRVAPGTYALRYRGSPPRQLPLAVFPEWQTQVFLTWQDRPLFEGMRVFMARRGRGFDPHDDVTQAVDLAISGLQNGINLLRRRDLDELLYGKFENPMLGILAAHVLLRRRGEVPPVVDTVLSNLERLVPLSPDVQALRVLVAMRRGVPPWQEPFFEVPMLRAGLEAVLSAAPEVPALLPACGLLERVAPRLYADTPWTCWRPERTKDGADRGSGPFSLGRPNLGFSDEGGALPAELDWVSYSVLDLIEQSLRRGRKLRRSELARTLRLSERDVVCALARFNEVEASLAIARGDWPRLGAAIASSRMAPGDTLSELLTSTKPPFGSVNDVTDAVGDCE